MSDIVQRAIDSAGGVAKLAKAVGVKHTSVIGWRARGAIPAERVKLVAEVTGIAPHLLRPDVFEVPPAEAAA